MIHFVVHEPGDGVGVVVVEGVKAGDDLIGWVMDGDLTLNMKSVSYTHLTLPTIYSV